MQNTIRRISSSILILLFSACSSQQLRQISTDDNLLLSADDPLESRSSISKAEAQSELSLLRYAFEQGYGGRKYVPQELYRHALAGLDSISSGLSSPVSTQSLCQRLAELLVTLPDNHLSVSLNGQDFSEEHRKLFTAGAVGPNLALKSHPVLTQIPWTMSQIQIGKLKVPVLSITSLPSHVRLVRGSTFRLRS
jgi:hypothetical protein